MKPSTRRVSRWKKLRALLRLVRPAIGDSRYRAENICFRDAARPLTLVRDAKILIETFDSILQHFQEHIAGRSFNAIRQVLEANLRAVRREVIKEQQAPTRIAAIVRAARDRVKDWSDLPNKWWVLGAGIENVHCRARIRSRMQVALRRSTIFTSGENRLNTCATNWKSYDRCFPHG